MGKAVAKALEGANWLEVSRILDWRMRARGNPTARALLDRALWILVRVEEADDAGLDVLEREVELLAEQLLLSFGAPPGESLQ